MQVLDKYTRAAWDLENIISSASGGEVQLRLGIGLPLPVQCTPDQRPMRGHCRVRNPPRSPWECTPRRSPIRPRLFLARFNS